MRGIEYLPAFTPTACKVNGDIEAVRVAAGHNNGEIQTHLAEYGKVIVTGANPSVGIVGWVTGGGHGFLSSTYGMGSDNLLEATVVLPTGSIVVANSCQNSDLFWAIRGGGGGTFGVVTEVVMKTHESPRTTMHVFTISSLSSTTKDEFWETMGWLHAQLQRLKEGGMQGYYYIVGPPVYPILSFLWAFMLFDKPNGTVEALTAPIEAHLTARANLFTYTSNTTHSATYSSLAHRLPNEPVANTGSTYGSRLLSPSSLSNPHLTTSALTAIGPSANASTPNVRPPPASNPPLTHPQGPISNPTLIGHMTAHSSPAPGSSSLNPAWRDTLVHLVVVESWQDGASSSLIDRVRSDVTGKTGVLRRLSPDTGAYFNEADANELDWQESFFGGNYDRLWWIKQDVDPNAVLWCRKCVGSEVFVEQRGGRLCEIGQDDGDDNGERDGMGIGEKSELRR